MKQLITASLFMAALLSCSTAEKSRSQADTTVVAPSPLESNPVADAGTSTLAPEDNSIDTTSFAVDGKWNAEMLYHALELKGLVDSVGANHKVKVLTEHFLNADHPESPSSLIALLVTVTISRVTDTGGTSDTSSGLAVFDVNGRLKVIDFEYLYPDGADAEDIMRHFPLLGDSHINNPHTLDLAPGHQCLYVNYVMEGDNLEEANSGSADHRTEALELIQLLGLSQNQITPLLTYSQKESAWQNRPENTPLGHDLECDLATGELAAGKLCTITLISAYSGSETEESSDPEREDKVTRETTSYVFSNGKYVNQD
jgi:hypothetical protein